MTFNNTDGTQSAAKQSGFTLIEVMISMVILTIGLLGVLGVFGVAIAATQTSQQDMIARQLASEAMESIFTARNTTQLTWSQIQNVSGGGIFTDGIQTLKCSGPDGLVGTADDATCLDQSGANCPAGVQCLTEPGADGIVGTADDVVLSLSNYTRQIAITPVLDAGGTPIPTLSSITVTIYYTVPKMTVQKTYVLNEYISQFQ